MASNINPKETLTCIFGSFLSEKIPNSERLKRFSNLIKYEMEFFELEPMHKIIKNKYIEHKSLPSASALKVELDNKEFDYFIDSSYSYDAVDRVEFEELVKKFYSFYSDMVMNRTLVDAGGVLNREGADAARSFLLSNMSVSKREILHLGELDLLSNYEKTEKAALGPMLYLEDIDVQVGGLQPGTLVSIFGYVGSLKTTMSLNIAYNCAVNMGYNVAYLCLEQPRDDLATRLLIRHSLHSNFDGKRTYIRGRDLRDKKLSTEQKNFLFGTVQEDFNDFSNSKGRIYLLDNSDFRDGVTPDSIESTLLYLDAVSEGGIDVWFLDYVQMIGKHTSRNMSENMMAINNWVRWMKNLSITFAGKGIVSFCLAQANRSGWERAVKNEGRYDMSAISEASEIEKASDVVISTFLDSNLVESENSKVQLLKNRFGKVVMDPIIIKAMPDMHYVGDFVKEEVSNNDILEIMNG